MNKSEYRSAFEAPGCGQCTYGVAALSVWRHAKKTDERLCVECARKIERKTIGGPVELQRLAGVAEVRSLLRPLLGRVVVLTDGPAKRSGLIILPDSVFGPGGKKKTDVVMGGLIVGVGDGWYARRSLGGAWLAEAPGVGVRKPMGARLGTRVVLLARHDAAIEWWRGLAVSNDDACLLLEEHASSESAAQ